MADQNQDKVEAESTGKKPVNKSTIKRIDDSTKNEYNPAPEEDVEETPDPTDEEIEELKGSLDNPEFDLPGLTAKEASDKSKTEYNLSPESEPSDPPPEWDGEIDDLKKPAIANADIKGGKSQPGKKIGVDTDSRWHRFKHAIATLWAKPYGKVAMVGSTLVLVMVVSFAIPDSRYALLNTFGLRTRAVLNVVDEETGRPVIGAEVELANGAGQTDENGQLELRDLYHGRSLLLVSQGGYQTYQISVRLDYGTNLLDEVRLDPNGQRLRFSVIDEFSELPIENIKASVDDGDATTSNENGNVVLSIDDTARDVIEITLTSKEYVEQVVEFRVKSDDQSFKLIPDISNVFYSQRNGKYEIYKSQLDGENQELLVAATGSEEPDTQLAIHHENKRAAFVSTRTGARNKDGYLLRSLHILDIDTGATTQISRSERIDIIGWTNDYLIFIATTEGTSAGNPSRNKLISYRLDTAETKVLSASNYFQDALVDGELVYYIPYDFNKSQNQGVKKIGANGVGLQTILKDKSVYQLLRTGPEKIVFESAFPKSKWYQYGFGGGLTQLEGKPANTRDIKYVRSPSGKSLSWIEARDGQEVLLHIGPEGEEQVVVKQKGLKQPMRWVRDDLIVYRVQNGDETADYIVSTETEEPRKIVDVYDSDGINRYQY